MSATLQFDDEASRRIEAIYGTPDVVAQRQAVLLALEAKPGERVLDIGAGPGFLAAELAAGVAPDGTVHAHPVADRGVEGEVAFRRDHPGTETSLFRY